MTDAPIRPDVEIFLNYLNNVPGPKFHQLPPADARQTMVVMRGVADADIGSLAVMRDIVLPGPAGSIPARLYDAKDARGPGPVMVFFHGGGFVIGNLDTHDPFCAEAARVLDIPVVAIDYRLAPENPWPAAPDDCEAAARWVAGSPDELERPATGLVLCGDSAGGNLTIVTAMALRDTPAAVPVLVQCPIYPFVDGSTDWGSYHEHAEGKLLTNDAMTYFGNAYAGDPGHARHHPLDHDQHGIPPSLVVTAGLDPLRDQGRAYAGALAAAGVAVTFREAAGMIHGFIQLRKAIPSSNADVAGILATLKPMIAEAAGALA